MDPMQALTQARRALKDMREAQEQDDTQAQLPAGHDLADAFESLNTWLASSRRDPDRRGAHRGGRLVRRSCDHDTVRASLAGIPARPRRHRHPGDGTTVDAETLGFMTTAAGRPCSPTVHGTRTRGQATMSCRCHWTTSSRSACSDPGRLGRRLGPSRSRPRLFGRTARNGGKERRADPQPPRAPGRRPSSGAFLGFVRPSLHPAVERPGGHRQGEEAGGEHPGERAGGVEVAVRLCMAATRISASMSPSTCRRIRALVHRRSVNAPTPAIAEAEDGAHDPRRQGRELPGPDPYGRVREQEQEHGGQDGEDAEHGDDHRGAIRQQEVVGAGARTSPAG